MKYHGVCIGGPWDGRITTCERPHFVVARHKPIKAFSPPGETITPCLFREERYEFHRWTIGSFWLHESVNERDVLKILLAAYAALMTPDAPHHQGLRQENHRMHRRIHDLEYAAAHQ